MCRFCNGTGSTQKTLTGYLDCMHCDTAEQRVKLEKWARREVPDVSPVDLWKIFQQGKAAAGSAQ